MTGEGGARPGWFSRLVRWVLITLYRLKGWQAGCAPPTARRAVVIGAPHTSNWDFVNFIGIIHELGLRPRFMGKHSLFRGPLRRFMYDMGGVPVIRSEKHDYVAQMIDAFAAHPDEFILVVAPEGTRRGVPRWRTGFYQIALGAGVPIICGYLDYPKRRAGLGYSFMPTGDYAADMVKVAEFYADKVPLHPRAGLGTLEWILGKD
ncbi:MAG: 1-acyl-sn-glycerol-3-phosphate acyltransferase [Proteobacteria bacterium]|nr:1-acyl-sn-glycerol-3-phosphate acyltransferase [Pseudomonadota bacterium]